MRQKRYEGPWVLVIAHGNALAFEPELCIDRADMGRSVCGWIEFLSGGSWRRVGRRGESFFEVDDFRGEVVVPRLSTPKWGREVLPWGAGIISWVGFRWREGERMTANGVTLLTRSNARDWAKWVPPGWRGVQQLENHATHYRFEFTAKRGRAFSLSHRAKVVNSRLPDSAF